MQYKNYLKLTLFMPVIGPLLVWGVTAVLDQLFTLGWIKDVQGFMFINLFGIVYFSIPYVAAVIVTWLGLKSKTNKAALISVCVFPLRVVVLSSLYLVVYLLVTEGLDVYKTIFEMMAFFVGMELLMGVPWVVLSLVLIPLLKRNRFLKV